MKFFPKSADGFLSAMMMAENALLRDFSLSCPASLFGAEPMESAKKAVKSCMTLSSFPCAQMLKTNTRYVHDFAKRTLTVTVNARYMKHRQRGERPAVRCGGYCGEHKARSAGKHRLFSGDCGLSKLAETLFRLQKDRCYARPRRCGALANAAGRVPGNRRAFHGDFAAPWHFGAVRLRRRLLRYGLGSTRVERGMGAERRMAPGRFHIRPAPKNDAEHVYAAR